MRNGNDASVGMKRHHWRPVGKLVRAALAGLRGWSNGLVELPSSPRACAEPLERRQLLTGFTVSVAAPETVTAGQQFYIYVWTAGGTMGSSDQYSVNFGDGIGYQPFSWNPNGPVTAIPYTYSSGGDPRSIIVQATGTAGQYHVTACQSLGMEALGNYPDVNGGPTTFVPSGASSSTPTSIVVDPGTGGAGYTYVAETYNTSGGGHQMALTRLDSSDQPDTQWGTYVSGSTYSGTLVVPAFGGGSTGTDVACGAAVGDQDGFDEIAITGYSANGMAAAIVNPAGTGSVLATSDQDGQTMPAGVAYAATFDDSDDVILAGTSSNQYNMVAIALHATTVTGYFNAGDLDTAFGQNENGVTSFGFGGTSYTVARAVMQEPDPTSHGNSDLVLAGWCSAGCGACSTSCNLIVVGFNDTYQGSNRGFLDTTDFGIKTNPKASPLGYNTVNLGGMACTADWNGCSGSGCGVPSNDSVYSLVWEDDLNADTNSPDIVAVGETNYSGANQPVLWGLSGAGQPDTAFGGGSVAQDGMAVPNIALNDFSPVSAIVGAHEGSLRDSDIYIAGTIGATSTDLFLARYHVPTSENGYSGSYGLDPYFGTSFNGTGYGQGYFVQDLGTASGASNDLGIGVAEEDDESVVLLGSTNSPGGSTVVIRYAPVSANINVLSPDSPPLMSLAAVQAASQTSTTSSTITATTPDVKVSDLSPLDGSGGQDPLHKRSASRPSVVSGASPPASSGLVTAPS